MVFYSYDIIDEDGKVSLRDLGEEGFLVGFLEVLEMWLIVFGYRKVSRNVR